MAESVLLPEQGQSHAGAAQLGVNMSPIGHRTLITWRRHCRRKKASIQLGVGEIDRPFEPACSEAAKVISRTGMADAQTLGDFAHGQAGVEFQPQHLSDFTHG